MTRKFKRAVRDVVYDGIVTPEEKCLLKEMAKEERISDLDFELYLAKRLKKRKVFNEKGNWWTKHSATIITVVGAFGTAVVTKMIEYPKNKDD